MIDADKTWSLFFENANAFEKAQEVFYSTDDHSPYQIISTINNIVRIQRLKSKTWETISIRKFRTCIGKLNKAYPEATKADIYDHVVEATTIVQLLPMLSWADKNKIIFLEAFVDSSATPEIEEAENEPIRKKVTREIIIRSQQQKLKEKLLEIYGSECVLTGCTIRQTLQACHIEGYTLSGINVSTNGLLFRSDIHNLFDANLLAVHPDNYKTYLHPSIIDSPYKIYGGQVILRRKDGKELNKAALENRWEIFNKKK